MNTERPVSGGATPESDGSLVRSDVVEQAPAIPRAYPTAGSMRASILGALLAGRSLTSGDVWREFGASRLAAEVHTLRRMGWPIVAEETLVVCRQGRRARVACYSLPKAPGVR